MKSEQQKAILEAVINRLNDIDCLIQETLGAGDVCYSIHSEIDTLIDMIGEAADSL
jgi:hypothetical protein